MDKTIISEEKFLSKAKSMITARWLMRRGFRFVPEGFSVEVDEFYRTKDSYKGYFSITDCTEIMLYMVRCYPESGKIYLMEYKKTGFEHPSGAVPHL